MASAALRNALVKGLIRRTREPEGLTDLEHAQLANVVSRWLAEDFVGCLNFLKAEGMLSLVAKRAALDASAVSATQNLPQALLDVLRIEDASLRDECLLSAFSAAGKVNPRQALENLGMVPDYLQHNAGRSLVESWVGQEGRLALESLIKDVYAKPSLVKQAVLALSEVDFKAALEVVVSAEASGQLKRGEAASSTALVAALFETRKLTPKEKLACVDLLPVGGQRQTITVTLATQAVVREPADFQTIIESIQDPGVRNLVLRDASGRLNPSAAPEAIRAAINALPSEQLRTPAATAAARQYAARDVEKGVDWARSIEEPLARSAAIRAAMEIWFTKSPRDALEYAAREPNASNDPSLVHAVTGILARLAAEPDVKFAFQGVNLVQLRSATPEAKAAVQAFVRTGLPPDRWAEVEALLK